MLSGSQSAPGTSLGRIFVLRRHPCGTPAAPLRHPCGTPVPSVEIAHGHWAANCFVKRLDSVYAVIVL
jgi:hypothetical protein